MRRSRLSKLAMLGLIVLVMAAGIGLQAPAARASVFTDTSTHWAKDTILWASNEGIVNGYADGTFKPNMRVSEPEFLAMLIRAFPDSDGTGAMKQTISGAWYSPFYIVADANSWTVTRNTGALNRFNRGHVAQLIASTQGQQVSLTESIRYLLDNGLSNGKTAATVEGYKAADPLTRAEAIQFLRNIRTKGFVVKAAPPKPAALKELQVQGIQLGLSVDEVIAKLGQPARKDLSRYGFEWYVYNKDLTQYTQIGIQDGKVVGMYTMGADWQAPKLVKPAMTRTDLESVLGKPVDAILKGNTYYRMRDDGTYEVFQLEGAYVTFYYDTHENNRIDGIYVVEENVERSLQAFYGQPSDRLRESYERQTFDLANAARARKGLTPFVWNDKVSVVSRLHSEDMAKRDYFSHTNQSGQGPGDRAKANQISFQRYGENIAAGQSDAMEAHHDWMNSKTGHREAILGNFKELGTGVAFGGSMEVYYTQNFYTSR